MRITKVLCGTLLALACTCAWPGAAVKVATNSDFGAGAMLNGVLLYAGDSGTSGVDIELWRSDGTVAGTAQVMDIMPGSVGSYPTGFVAFNGSVYFGAQANPLNPAAWSLWKTDGTAAGTLKVADLPGQPTRPQVAGGAFYFNVASPSDLSVWRSDGTAAGTLQLKGGFSVFADEFTAAAGKVFFSGNESTHGEELWMTDGTPAGTALVSDINPGSNSSQALGLHAMGGILVFAALDPSGFHMWTSDGTVAGTQPIPGGPTFCGDVGPAIGGGLLFSGSDATAGCELWRTDGTAAGTYRLADLVAGTGSSNPAEYIGYQGVGYFSAASVAGGPDTILLTNGAGVSPMAAVLPSGATVTRVLGGANQDFFFLVQAPTGRSVWGVDPNLKIARKRLEITGTDSFAWFRLAPGGLFVAIARATSTELWFVPVENPAGDDDNDGVPNGVEPGEGLNPQVKDNDIFSSARLFAMQQYRDFLGREGDAGGITFYTNGITSGTSSRGQVIENFFNSPEFSGSVSPIARLYFATFLRIPDYGGLLFQVGAFRAGTPLDVIANNFTQSPEFQSRYGSLDDPSFVALLYQNILGRTPSQSEIDYHVARLAAGATRGAVLVGFSESPEYQQLTAHDVYVTMMYVGMLRRAPEQSGFDYWVAYMDAGNPGLALILGFLQAPEYRNRFLP